MRSDQILKYLRYYGINHKRKAWNILRSKWRSVLAVMISRYSTRAFSPDTFILKLTDRCNLRCTQCGQWGDRGVYARSGISTGNQELSRDVWIDFIRHCQHQISHIYFWGGEPFLRPDLLEIAGEASRNGITSEIVTNGILLEKYAEDVMESGVDSLYVSIDGPETIHNRIRNGPGNGFQKILTGLHKLKTLKLRRNRIHPMIQVIMTLTHENQMHIFDTYQVAKSAGADVFSFQYGLFTTEELVRRSSERFQSDFGMNPVFWSGFIRDMTDIDTTSIDRQMEMIRADTRSNHEPAFRCSPGFDFDTECYYRHPEQPLMSKKCPIPWRYLEIRPNGDVALCVDFPDVIAGNITSNDWRTLWNSRIFRQFRHSISQKGLFPACSRCCAYLDTGSHSRLMHILHSMLH